MNKTRLIWGIVCLVLAAALAVLNLALPADSIRFDLGGRNMPWVPPVVLGVAGVVLLATAWGKQEQPAQTPAAPDQAAVKPVEDPEKKAINKRYENAAWGFFLIMLGGFALVPDTVVPKGLWSIGVGLIMLGLNLARYLKGIRMSGFTTVLGILALLGGIAELLGWTELNGALLLIVLGVYLIFKPWFDQRQLFGKAEHGRS